MPAAITPKALTNPQVLAPKTDQNLILLRTNVSGYFFDAVLKMDHTSSMTITTHPVQTGANISDHAYVNPSTLVMEIGMSDVMTDTVDGQFTAQGSRSVSAYQILRQLQQSRMPLQIYTRLKLYQNMLIESIEAPDDVKTLYGLRATVVFKEIFVVQVSKTTVSSRPQTTGSTSRGSQQPQDPGSALYQMEQVKFK